jgi:alanyl-tRNA synthetase
LTQQIQEINGVQFLAVRVDLNPEGVWLMIWGLGTNMFWFGTADEDKPMLSCYISRDKKIKCRQVVRELGKYIQGGGGGQPFFATAGGKKCRRYSRGIKQGSRVREVVLNR